MNYIRVTSTSSDVQVSTTARLVVGWSFSASADAKFYLRDGDDDTAPIVVVVNLNSNQSITEQFNGITFYEGVFVDIVSGTIEGSIWVE